MPEQRRADGGSEGTPLRPIRYRAMIKFRLERETFLRVFSAARAAGSSSTSDWMRRVLGEAAARELDRHPRRRPPGP